MASKPTSLGVSRSATRKHKNAGVGPFHSIEIALELLFRPRVFQSGGILLYGPILEVWIYIAPVETALAVRRIAEVIDLMSSFAESCYYIGIEGISPAACYIYLCHNGYVCMRKDNKRC